jgi:hypothetical protein
VTSCGILLSGIGLLSYRISNKISIISSVDRADPTVWQRKWRALFDRIFLPAGEVAISAKRNPKLNQISFLLAVGMTVLFITMLAYVLLSGTVIATAYGIYQMSGMVPDLTSVIEKIAVMTVVFSFAVMTHATERADRVCPNR